MGQFQEAEKVLLRSLETVDDVLGSEHASYAQTLVNLSWVRRKAGDADGAVTGLDVAALVRAFGPSQPGNPADMDGDGEVDLDDLSLLHTALR